MISTRNVEIQNKNIYKLTRWQQSNKSWNSFKVFVEDTEDICTIPKKYVFAWERKWNELKSEESRLMVAIIACLVVSFLKLFLSHVVFKHTLTFSFISQAFWIRYFG
jgi:hypothetical protein